MVHGLLLHTTRRMSKDAYSFIADGWRQHRVQRQHAAPGNAGGRCWNGFLGTTGTSACYHDLLDNSILAGRDTSAG